MYVMMGDEDVISRERSLKRRMDIGLEGREEKRRVRVCLFTVHARKKIDIRRSFCVLGSEENKSF